MQNENEIRFEDALSVVAQHFGITVDEARYVLCATQQGIVRFKNTHRYNKCGQCAKYNPTHGKSFVCPFRVSNGGRVMETSPLKVSLSHAACLAFELLPELRGE